MKAYFDINNDYAPNDDNKAGSLSLKNLKNEEDLIKYLTLLKEFSRRYTVIITSYDTPFGPGYSERLSHYIMSLGVKTNLFGKYRHGYVAVIDAGKAVFEKLSSGNAVVFDMKLGDCEVKTVSTGYNSNDWVSCLTINGKNCFAKSRGLNFAVFDKVTGYILDCVGFDTYSEGCPCSRPTQTVEFIKNIYDKYGVKIVVCKFPVFPATNLTPNEEMIVNNKNNNAVLLNYYDANGVDEVTTIPQSYYDTNGARRFCDYNSQYLNTNGGHRVTHFQPKSHKRTIFLVGGCRMYGIGSDDSKTVESYLQRLFNDNLPDEQIIVQNYGFMFTGMKKNEMPTIIENLPLKAGDIVLTEFNLGGYEGNDISVIDISNAFCCSRSFDVFYDTVHYTPDGNAVTAESLFKSLISQGLLDNVRNETNASESYGFDNSTSKELKEYKDILREYYSEKFPERIIGSIVMNCNPFTLGHRYLIEKALEQCDFLIIFVVQEDKSIFPFEDRLKLVDECTADIENKEVIPSGKFIISSLTFSEYFNKSEMQGRTIDTSLDVTVFAREIAPCLHIKKRFVGEEPNDSVTRQYNETMARILPEYGIELVEIPRAEVNDQPISASNVRLLLEKKQFEEIKKLVPEPTYNYLVADYEK